MPSMVDSEVLRLRQLRGSALQLRAIAQQLERQGSLRDTDIVGATGRAAWRIARIVSGRLMAHPHLGYQRGPTAFESLRHSAVAVGARALCLGRGRRWALHRFAQAVRRLGRELGDARALTWAQDLSDAFGRSQAELQGALGRIDSRAGMTPPRRSDAAVCAIAANETVAGDWPYLAL